MKIYSLAQQIIENGRNKRNVNRRHKETNNVYRAIRDQHERKLEYMKILRSQRTTLFVTLIGMWKFKTSE